MLEFDAKAVAEMERNMMLALQQIIESARQYMDEHTEEVKLHSQAMCPKDTTTLVNTAFTRPAALIEEEIVAVIGYADEEHDLVNPETGLEAAMYAQDVHETLGYVHVSGSAKFLENPLYWSADKFRTRMAKAAADVLGGKAVID